MLIKRKKFTFWSYYNVVTDYLYQKIVQKFTLHFFSINMVIVHTYVSFFFSMLMKRSTSLPLPLQWSQPRSSVLRGPSTRFPPGLRFRGTSGLPPSTTLMIAWRKLEDMFKKSAMVSYIQKKLKIHYINFALLSFSLSRPLPHPSHLPIDLSLLPTRGPCSKYELDIEEGKFRGKFDFSLTGPPLRVSNGMTLYKYVQYCRKGSNFHHFTCGTCSLKSNP